MANQRIEERKARDRATRRTQITTVARQIAEAEGWPSVTLRRLSDKICYSQPVLYSHFENREAIVSAAAVEGFQELGERLKVARERVNRRGPIDAVATAYLEFAAVSPALYEAMFNLSLNVPFGDDGTPAELRFAFSQLMHLFSAESRNSEVCAELFWASLHGLADLTRTGRLPMKRRKDRLKALMSLFDPLAKRQEAIDEAG